MRCALFAALMGLSGAAADNGTTSGARTTYYFLVGTANFLGGELQNNTHLCEMDGATGEVWNGVC
jgi:hypothetical protein